METACNYCEYRSVIVRGPQGCIPVTSSSIVILQFEWDFEKDKSFKEKMAFMTTDYCDDNKTRCALKDSRRKR
ncbi:hypothetical protein OS493_036540 [Desmophyllum pertusum]|uniref:Uncharacterized protein n=1 Tax=Desmophyllum pertusum TaxID=174260 RepID=A0A9W9Z748_9CNID|nr:hypothetical protein OS493_036540 [Desmophyllum pertusum]